MDELDVKVQRLLKYYRVERNNPVIKNLAYGITQGETTRQGKLTRIINWVRGNIRYQREPAKLDIIVPPARLVNLRTGDCEDISLIISTLSGIVGIPTKWKVISQDGRKWTHIYPLVPFNGYYRPVDLAAPIGLGSEVSYAKSRIYNVT